MNSRTMIGLMLAGVLGIVSADLSSATAQSTLGGAKTPQNKIGGVAKPAPVVGGATVHPYSPPAPPKPGPLVGMAKPGSPGLVTPGATGSAAVSGAPKPNPPVTPPKSGPVVTSNLKCASGACSSRGPKP